MPSLVPRGCAHACGRAPLGRCGTILLAINPYRWLPVLYSVSARESFALARPDGAPPPPPHIFACADRAYKALRRSGCAQSLVVSGESGAGKTETSKKVMEYVAWCGERGDKGAKGAGGASVAQRLLDTNHVLEAFGNAKTLRRVVLPPSPSHHHFYARSGRAQKSGRSQAPRAPMDGRRADSTRARCPRRVQQRQLVALRQVHEDGGGESARQRHER